MLREVIIVLVIVISIIVIDCIIQDYTKESVEHTSKLLSELKQDMKDGEYKNGLEKIYKEWDKDRDKLAFFIEHDELEKVETNLTNIKSSLKTEQQDIAVLYIDEAIFILEHIKDKNSFNLENIF